MPIRRYACDHCDQWGARGKEVMERPVASRTIYHPDGRRERVAQGEPPPPPTCCGHPMRLVPARSRANLVADATQICGWDRPGMTDVNYRNGPDGVPATHLRDMHGQPAYADDL